MLSSLGTGGGLTASEISKRLGVRLDSLSGVLRRMVDKRELSRVKGGPRGGNVYSIPGLFQKLQQQMVEQMQREMDRRILEMFDMSAGMSDIRKHIPKGMI